MSPANHHLLRQLILPTKIINGAFLMPWQLIELEQLM